VSIGGTREVATLHRVAMDIVPIQLSLTAGDLITLWAPSWREGGEEWEGFLGDEDGVHAFPDAGMLTAYVRTVPDHDLTDHPAWPLVLQLPAPDLVPTEDQCYDLLGVPEIAAAEPDSWLVGELAGITALVRSLADTCGLDQVHAVLDGCAAFAVLDKGVWAFHGRDGARLWAELTEVITHRWDEIVTALDAVVSTPPVEPGAAAAARREFAEAVTGGTEPDQPVGAPAAELTGTVGTEPARLAPVQPAGPGAPRTEAAGFWEEVGIDPILISLDDADYYTLRSYLDDRPVFLGGGGRIHVLASPAALARYLTDPESAAHHDLARASTWPQVLARAGGGELTVEVDPQNVYQLAGLNEDLAAGPHEVDPHQLDLAVELLLDVGEWAGDDGPQVALSRSQSLGWLTSFVLDPEPNRLAPSPPFDSEVARWNGLVKGLASRLRRR
jgi:hypothetical protein